MNILRPVHTFTTFYIPVGYRVFVKPNPWLNRRLSHLCLWTVFQLDGFATQLWWKLNTQSFSTFCGIISPHQSDFLGVYVYGWTVIDISVQRRRLLSIAYFGNSLASCHVCRGKVKDKRKHGSLSNQISCMQQIWRNYQAPVSQLVPV